MTKTPETHDAASVEAHAGGTSPGVSGSEPTRGLSRVRASRWYPLLKKVISVSAGMVGLSAIGLVAGAPERDRVAMMGVAGDLTGSWLAGAEAPHVEQPLTKSSDRHDAPSGASTPAPSSEPSAAPNPSSEPGLPAPEQRSPATGITADGKVVLNLATADELTRLPGVGQKRAEKILELRARLGRFKSPNDLLRVKGIGPKSLRKMLPHLVLDAPSAG
jgi:competence protein ComEA